MKYLMRHVKRVAQPRNAWRSQLGEWITYETLALYESVKALCMFKGRNGALRTRFQEFSWRTIVNPVCNHKGILGGEEPLPSEESNEEETNKETIEENNDDEFHDCVWTQVTTFILRFMFVPTSIEKYQSPPKCY